MKEGKGNISFNYFRLFCSGMFFCILAFLLLPLFSDSQTFEIVKGDTINYTDKNSLRQGLWLITNKAKNLPDFGPDQLVEEVHYVDGKKEGMRKQYFPSGKLKSEVIFSKNIPFGYSKIYYPNGNISEEGVWKSGSWDGVYKYYYDDGKLCYQWIFKDGKRDGEQRYFHPNGELNYIGIWKEGNEAGVVREFNSSGQLVAEKNYNEGKLDEASTKYFTPSASDRNDKKEDVGLFTGNGYYKLKNKNGQPMKEGTFRNGNLNEGKYFQYSSEGKLLRTLIYKDGKILQTIEEKQ